MKIQLKKILLALMFLSSPVMGGDRVFIDDINHAALQAEVHNPGT